MIELETYDQNGTQYIISNPANRQWSTHYGENGGGYGHFRFTLLRQVGFNYQDIGFGYRVILRKYLSTILFDGQIRQIEEASSGKGDRIKVTALGHVIVAQDEELLRAFCDSRLSRWGPVSEVPKTPFRPDLFAHGSNALGLYLNAANKETAVNEYTQLDYDFNDEETAERVRCTLSTNLGPGVIFEATVVSIDTANNYVYYTNNSGESNLGVDMILFNQDVGESTTILAVDTGTNRITGDSGISGWGAGNSILVYGPLFNGQISNIVDAIITYTNPIGEGNLGNGQMLANITQKAVAEIQSFDTGANTITVTDENHITGWQIGDIVHISAAMFEAVFNSSAATIITYTSPRGEQVVSSATGWVLHNVTLNQVTDVSSWNVVANQVTISDAADISTWVSGNVLRIYTPYRFSIRDSNDNLIWPSSDWRLGAITRNKTSIDILTTGSPTGFRLRLEAYIAGSGSEQSFVQLSNLRVYSTEGESNITTLAQYAVSILSGTGHNLNSDTSDIANISHLIEPMVFEFKTVNQALSEIASYGDENFEAIAWGIRLNDQKRLYVETQDSETVQYIVRRIGKASLASGADANNSVQKVRAIYTDKLGSQQITYWVQDESAWFGGQYRSDSTRLGNADTLLEAVSIADKFLADKKLPRPATSYSVGSGSVFTREGMPVPFDEIKATGKLIEIEDWRANESGSRYSGLGSAWVREQLVGVQINYESKTAKLIPGGGKKSLERYLAELSRIANL